MDDEKHGKGADLQGRGTRTGQTVGWVNEAIARSRAQGHCAEQLAAWILSVADRSLRSVYGDDYSDRCLQASECIRVTLAAVGIQGNVVTGALCVATIYSGPPLGCGWSGFWGEDHHVWVVTEFREFADLTISQLHLHRASRRSDALVIPAFWWHPYDEWPPIVRYLPNAPIDIQLSREDASDLDRICKHALKLVESEREMSAAPEMLTPVLTSIDALNRLDKEGLPWIAACRLMSGMLPEWPAWVVRRWKELTGVAFS